MCGTCEVFDAGGADPNRGVYLDPHEANASLVYKAFGSFDSFNGHTFTFMTTLILLNTLTLIFNVTLTLIVNLTLALILALTAGRSIGRSRVGIVTSPDGKVCSQYPSQCPARAPAPRVSHQYLKLPLPLTLPAQVWSQYTPVDEMGVSADTANNLLFDSHLGLYLAFSRAWNHTEARKYGGRRELRCPHF